MTIGDRFVLREMIGSGGMGKVYRADQVGVGRTVAVKIMHPHLVGDDTAVARFTNEARASSQLNHPHSIGVIDFGQTETGILYIVMEFLAGRPLDIVLRQEYPMPFGQIAYMACQAMEAVHAAHKLNIVHRDLKPENIFLLQRKTGLDFVKVLDFGIAKMLDHEDRSVTTPGLVPGTPEYMSPEQARGEKLDPRSDVYSLGVILYELLTNTVPFRGKSAIATMMSHVQDPPELPSRRAPNRNIPAALEAIVLWALAKDPSDRIESAEHFRDVVSAWAHVAGVWPKTTDMRASSPDVLLDFFSEDQLNQFREEVIDDRTPTAQEVSVAAPRAAEQLIGRQAALNKLQQFVEKRGPRVMRIFGEPGVGKSRLVKELISSTPSSDLAILHHRPKFRWMPQVLAVAHEVARFCLGIETKGSEPIDAETLLTAASKITYDADNIPGLRELFALPSHISQLEPDARRRERATAFRQLVYAQAERKPTLLVFECIDQYDDSSRELILSLVAQPEGELAVIVTHGPEDRYLWPPEVTQLHLLPLDLNSSAELFETLFQNQSVDKATLDAAAGNPLFIEQLAHAIHHDHLTTPPDKLVDLVAGRLDASAQVERSALQLMAVIGSPVTVGDLKRMMGAEKAEEELLDSLVDRGLARRVDERYAFSHDLLGAVAYSSIPAEVRRKIHHQVAENMSSRDADDAVIAYHAYHADDGPSAIEALERAGGWATQCLDAQGAILHYTRALELVRREWGRGRMSPVDLDRIAVELARNLGAVLRQTGDLLTAEGVLAEVLSVAAGKDLDRAGLRLDLGRIDIERGNKKRAMRHLQLAQADADTAGGEWLLGEIMRELARVHGQLGEVAEAGKLLHDSLQLAASGETAMVAPLLQAAEICTQINLLDRARGYLLDALQQGDTDRSSLDKLRLLMLMSSVHQSCSEWSEAELRLGQAIELAARVGDRSSRVTLLIDLGRVRRIGGDVEGARKQLETAIKLSRNIGWWDGIKRAEQEAEMLRYAVPQAL